MREREKKKKRERKTEEKILNAYFRTGEGRGWGTPLDGLHRFVWPQRVWFFSSFGYKEGIDLASLVINRAWFLHSSHEYEFFFKKLLFQSNPDVRQFHDVEGQKYLTVSLCSGSSIV